jgi:2-iminobutanoate/2-iminopropanoate deaminase
MPRTFITCNKPWEAVIPFSLGVKVSGSLVMTAGITARDANGAVVGQGDMRAQLEQCFKSAEEVLQAGGARWDQVVKLTIFVTDIEAFKTMSEVRAPFMRHKPASSVIGVSALMHPDLMVEIEATAAVD